MASQEASSPASLRNEAAAIVARLQTAIGHLESILFNTHGVSNAVPTPVGASNAPVGGPSVGAINAPVGAPSVSASVSSAHGALDELSGLVERIESSL